MIGTREGVIIELVKNWRLDINIESKSSNNTYLNIFEINNKNKVGRLNG